VTSYTSLENKNNREKTQTKSRSAVSPVQVQFCKSRPMPWNNGHEQSHLSHFFLVGLSKSNLHSSCLPSRLLTQELF